MTPTRLTPMARRLTTTCSPARNGWPRWCVPRFPRSTVPVYPFIAAGLAVAAAGPQPPLGARGGPGGGRRQRRLLPAPAAHATRRRPGLVVSPADGLVCLIETAAPPAELGLGADPVPRISIFLSLFDAHVQRIPVGGEVLAVSPSARQLPFRRTGGRQ